MCWQPSRAPLGVRQWSYGITQPWVTRALISWVIQVGRRDRADATSFSSDDGSLARIFRIASPALFVAPYFRISVKDAHAITERSKAVVRQWPKIAKRLRISVREQQRMASAFRLAE